MSIATAFTFLSKVFGKFSATFSLFFLALAGSYYLGIINQMVFNAFFIVLLIMLLVDVSISFYINQDRKIMLAKQENLFIKVNYGEYRKTRVKNKEKTTEEHLKDLGIGAAADVVKVVSTKISRRDKRAALKAEIDKIEAEILEETKN